jgi:MFS family permease
VAVALASRAPIRPRLSLGLLTIQHALLHGQAALYPLVYLAVIDEFGVTAATIIILSTVAGFATGMVQLSFGVLTRHISRRTLLGAGGLLMATGTALQSVAPAFAWFAGANVVSRLGAAPQHPVGNALIADQFPSRRTGTAIAVHVAGGNIGTVVVGFAAAASIGLLGWRGAVLLLGMVALVFAVAILLLVGEHRRTVEDGAHIAPARQLYRRVVQDRDMRWLFLATTLGGGSRGLGVLNIFVPLYLDQVVGLDGATIGLMYGLLLAASVPGPLVAGWLSDRIGRKPVIVAVYVAGAASLSLFVLAGNNLAWLWIGVFALSLTSFVESPQLQALVADMATPELRDAAFSIYFALAFGVGSLWGLLYGAVADLGGPGQGLGIAFWIMAVSSVVAALATMRIHIPRNRRPAPA